MWTAALLDRNHRLISLGWIFFRANSLLQARQMLSAVLAPKSYLSHFLSGSLYLLVAAVAAGYAITLFMIDTLARYSDDRKPPNQPPSWLPNEPPDSPPRQPPAPESLQH